MKRYSPTRRRFVQALNIARRWWWMASGERARVLADLEQCRARRDELFRLYVTARDALWNLSAGTVPAHVDLLRAVADEIDCGQACERIGPMDWSTGVRECPGTDHGDCAGDNAAQLRDLANALEAKAKVGGR